MLPVEVEISPDNIRQISSDPSDIPRYSRIRLLAVHDGCIELESGLSAKKGVEVIRELMDVDVFRKLVSDSEAIMNLVDAPPG